MDQANSLKMATIADPSIQRREDASLGTSNLQSSRTVNLNTGENTAAIVETAITEGNSTNAAIDVNN